MFSTIRLAAYATLALTDVACGPSIEVRTMAAPDAGLTALHTFHMLPGPARRDGQAATGVDDPMISNSIANRAIREQIVKAFEGRGYTRVERSADFAVAFYATAREKHDVTVWDYGYPFYPGWPRYARPVERVATYTEGSVIIDVIKPATRNRLWRGEGRAELSSDPNENVAQLGKAASAIIAAFPHATSPVVAVRP